ncbi:PQQ-like beta-propeller repeat protein [Hymenobacter sp. BT770]|uniref:PQQ-like beta-propeller repeat protein n=1 Tax=Hymenobacter sp. BT770 TaxID=2886942 RepID=UPI001D1181B7|nr:PQQ-like beta-propeller repeat protein [Hymenobacter sp. BT770]MCC3153445.1 PQQ-like beta-propeller repeat protein [Hymenobacter sp. BT770]MDO3415473.1 PQQ-like beta-propeller repeat protein [Hymenobacter sp. BT770]
MKSHHNGKRRMKTEIFIVLAIAVMTGCKSTHEPDLPSPVVTVPTGPALPQPLGHSSMITVPKVLNELVNLYPGRSNSEPFWAQFVSAADVSFSTGYFAATTVVRIDTAGRPVWAKTYSMPSVTGSGAFAPCPSGGGLVVVRSPGTLTTGSTSFVVARLNDQGVVQWSNEYSTTPTSQINAVSYGVLPLADGGSVVYTAEREALILFGLDPVGNLRWERKTAFSSTQVEGPQLVELPTGKLVMVARALRGAFFTRFSAVGVAEQAVSYVNSQVETKPEGGQLRALADGTVLVALQDPGSNCLLQLSSSGRRMKATYYFTSSAMTDFDLLPTGEGALLMRNQNQQYFYHVAVDGEADGVGQRLGSNSTVLIPFLSKSPMQVVCTTEGSCYSLGRQAMDADILYGQFQFHKTNRRGNNFCPTTSLQAVITGRETFAGLAALNEQPFTGIQDVAAPTITVVPRAVQAKTLPVTVVRGCQ